MADPHSAVSSQSPLRRLFVFWLPLLFVTWLVFPSFYYSPKMAARVVTPDGKPVAGAIVVVSWTMHKSWNNVPVGPLKVEEVVTNADGWFRVPAWGPAQPDYALNSKEPIVRIFKPGLVPLTIYNVEGVGMSSANRILRFRLQGQTITLEQFAGSPVEYERSLGPFIRELDQVYGTSKLRCQWRQRYRILLAVQDVSMGAAQGRPVVAQYNDDISMTDCGDSL